MFALPRPDLIDTVDLSRLTRKAMAHPYSDASDAELARWADECLVAGEFDEAGEIAAEANRRAHAAHGRAA